MCVSECDRVRVGRSGICQGVLECVCVSECVGVRVSKSGICQGVCVSQ